MNRSVGVGCYCAFLKTTTLDTIYTNTNIKLEPPQHPQHPQHPNRCGTTRPRHACRRWRATPTTSGAGALAVHWRWPCIGRSHGLDTPWGWGGCSALHHTAELLPCSIKARAFHTSTPGQPPNPYPLTQPLTPNPNPNPYPPAVSHSTRSCPSSSLGQRTGP